MIRERERETKRQGKAGRSGQTANTFTRNRIREHRREVIVF